jgi:hypothetical protein
MASPSGSDRSSDGHELCDGLTMVLLMKGQYLGDYGRIGIVTATSARRTVLVCPFP